MSQSPPPSPGSLLHEPGGSGAPPSYPDGVPGAVATRHGRWLPLTAAGVALAVFLALVLAVLRPWEPAPGGRAAPVAAGGPMTGWPTAGPASPATPPGAPTWSPAPVPGESTPQDGDGTPAPTGGPVTGTATGSTTDAGTGTGAGTGSSGSGADPYCATARHGLAAAGSAAATALRELASRAGDGAPQARDVVRQAVATTQRLSAGAPPAVADAAGTLAAAWSRLAADLDRSGYGRVELVGLTLKYLAGPAVGLAWEVLARWVGDHCSGGLGARAADR